MHVKNTSRPQSRNEVRDDGYEAREDGNEAREDGNEVREDGNEIRAEATLTAACGKWLPAAEAGLSPLR